MVPMDHQWYVKMVIQWQQWSSIGTNGVIGDSGANGSPMVPMGTMVETVPMAIIMLILKS